MLFYVLLYRLHVWHWHPWQSTVWNNPILPVLVFKTLLFSPIDFRSNISVLHTNCTLSFPPFNFRPSKNSGRVLLRLDTSARFGFHDRRTTRVFLYRTTFCVFIDQKSYYTVPLGFKIYVHDALFTIYKMRLNCTNSYLTWYSGLNVRCALAELSAVLFKPLFFCFLILVYSSAGTHPNTLSLFMLLSYYF